MNAQEAYEIEELLNELSQYKYSYIQPKVNRIIDVLTPIFKNEKEKEFRRERKLKWSWGDYNPAQKVAQTHTNLAKINGLCDEASREVNFLDKETQDILHAIEFTDMTEDEMKEATTNLKRIRQERRKAKDFILVTQPLAKFAKENDAMIKQLAKIVNETQSNITKLSNRTYTPRTMSSLEDAFKEAEEKQKK